MALISSELVDYSQHVDGGRARYRYTFTNHVIDIGPIFVTDQAQAQARISEFEAEAIRQAKKRDAVGLADIVDKGEATKADLAKQFIERAMSESESYKAYQKLNKFNIWRNEQGYTMAQVKTALGFSDDDWTAITARWTYLSSNAATIEAYAVIVAGDN